MMFALLVCVEHVPEVVRVVLGQSEPAGNGAGAGGVDFGGVGEAGEGVEADDAAVRVVRLMDTSQGGERGQVASSVDAEFHDHAGSVEDQAVERVEGQQVGERLAAQVQDEMVDQFFRWDGGAVEQSREPMADRALVF